MKKKAFTLVELLIVVVIIGILATIVTLALSSYSAKAKNVKAKTAIEEVQKAIQIMAADEDGFPADCVSSTRYIDIQQGGASSGDSKCTSGDLKLISAPKDGKNNPIKLQYTSETNYRISGKTADEAGKCWYVSATSKEGLSEPTDSTTYCP
ncbi:MAG: Type II secretion system protein G precursor [candidate division WS2 bacterium ADurb.Bin280]|uniref:Type II secretion system protein G n=1 Tax=candidate division WS2 bacterium ADurb.Bin280 TaxID=1852829 RepID=A0A1V5SDN1_9BACT|nr:MAG: Type II secretion system protein G precursor [candidate division WS2 bacterium ADurb.Bin280]